MFLSNVVSELLKPCSQRTLLIVLMFMSGNHVFGTSFDILSRVHIGIHVQQHKHIFVPCYAIYLFLNTVMAAIHGS